MYIMFEKAITRFRSSLIKLSGYVFYLLLLILTISLSRNISKMRQINKEVQQKEEKVKKLEEEGKGLGKKLEEAQSNDYIEKQIRDKLGLAKPGEIVVVLPDEAVLRKLAPKMEEGEDSLPDPNWKKWAKLFGL